MKKGGEMKTNEKTHTNTTKERKEEITMHKNTLIQEISPKGGDEMKDTIDQLIVEGQALAEKQSWVRKSYDELMKRLNEQIKEIPRMDEDPIRYTVYEWKEQETGHRHKVRLALHFDSYKGNAYLALEERWEDTTSWYTDHIFHPDLDVMRAVGKHLGDAVSYFLEKVRERGIEHDSVFATLTDLATKLQ